MDTVKALQFYKILQQVALIGVSILFAKIGLSTDAIGMYELLFFVGAVFTFFWVNGIMHGILPVYPALNEEEKRSFIFTNYFTFLMLSLIVFTILSLGKKFILPMLTGHQSIPHFYLFLIFLTINLPTYLVEHIYLLQNKAYKIISWGIFSFVGYALVVIAPLLLGYDLTYSFYGLIGLAILKHLWTLSIVIQDSNWKWSRRIANEVFSVSSPLVLYAFIGGFPILFDKWLVSWWFQEESVFAIFSYGARELPLATAMASALSAALIPQISENIQKGLAELKSRSTNLMHLIFPIGIFLVAINEILFPIIFNFEFKQSALVFNVYLLIIISRLIFPQSVLIAKKETKPMLWISIVELLINVVLSLMLIQQFGILGVAFATFIAYLFEKIAIAFVVRRKFGIAFSEYTNVKWLVGYSFILICVYLVGIFNT